MKISELSKLINMAKKDVGNVEVFLSSDTEGNSFGTMNIGSLVFNSKGVVLFPFEEHLDCPFGDIESYSFKLRKD